MKWLPLLSCALLFAGLGLWLAWRALPRPTVQGPATPPRAIAKSLDEVLDRLDRAIKEHSPSVAAALRPGLEDMEIQRIEREHGLQLPAEVSVLYRWHDGVERESGATLFDGLAFPSLSELAETREAYREQVEEATMVQKLAHRLLLSHQEGWIELFPDGSGNGVFADPARGPEVGPVFFHDDVEGPQIFFRSLAELLDAFAEGHERGLHRETFVGWDPEVYEAIQEIYEARGVRPAWPGAPH